jgi:hypothetical protein
MERPDVCGKCKYFEASPEVPKGGFCYRQPPTVMIGQATDAEGKVKMGAMGSTFPPTLKSSHCGEFEKDLGLKIAQSIPAEPLQSPAN